MADHLLLQFTDIHLSATGALRNGTRPGENFEAALAHLGRSGIAPDVIVCTGDLTDDGDGERYEELRVRIRPLAEASGAAVVFLPGNHDERTAFRRHLLDEDDATDGPINQVVWREGLRILALDSSVPGAEHGELTPETLAFARAALADAAPDGTVVALHHPPIPSPIESMTAIALRQPEQLAAALAGSDVRLILAGHNHHAAAGSLAGVPVWVSPALAYRADISSTTEFRPQPGSAVTRVDLPSGSPPTATVIEVPLPPGRG